MVETMKELDLVLFMIGVQPMILFTLVRVVVIIIKYMMTFIKVLALFWHTRWTKPPRTVKMEASEMGAVMAWRISGFSG